MALNDSAGQVQSLRAELDGTRQRLEEVITYYRGQLEAVRERSKDEIVRVQAAEAGRRRRAENQLGELKGELEQARASGAHSERRYQELRGHLEELEQQQETAQRQAANAVEPARAAWKTAEEEVERLDGELSTMRQELAAAREAGERLQREQTDAEEARRHSEQERRRLIARLKQALKLSEQRRRALEAQVSELGARLRREPEPAALAAGKYAEIEVDPTAGWGTATLGAGDDFADEFLMMGSDQSLDEQTASQDSGGTTAEHSAEGAVSDQEAEALIMELDVDRKLAQRRSWTSPPPSGKGPVSPPPLAAATFLERYGWILTGGAAAGAVGLGALLWFLFIW